MRFRPAQRTPGAIRALFVVPIGFFVSPSISPTIEKITVAAKSLSNRASSNAASPDSHGYLLAALRGASENKTMTKHLSLVQVDVFTATRLEGNALAVVLDGSGLSDRQMQAFAKETNLSETTFILPREAATERERGVRVRIFTVSEELPFAGHPTLGTAFVLRGRGGAAEVRLDLQVGTVPVRFEDADGKPSFGEMTQVDPKFGAQHDRGK
jgi:hypothetical protein